MTALHTCDYVGVKVCAHKETKGGISAKGKIKDTTTHMSISKDVGIF